MIIKDVNITTMSHSKSPTSKNIPKQQEMQERDQQILQDLQELQAQIEQFKNDAMKSHKDVHIQSNMWLARNPHLKKNSTTRCGRVAPYLLLILFSTSLSVIFLFVNKYLFN